MQHGFLPGRSTQTAYFTYIPRWYAILYACLDIDICYLNFKRAFDSVPHNLLLIKFKSLNLNDRTVNWIISYPAKRIKCVIVDGSLSGFANVTSGVPQGSVIGPILFLIYINDLPRVLHFSKCVMFAGENFQHDLDSIMDRSERWLLSLNEKKCNFMYLGRGVLALVYILRGSPLKVMSEYCALGVMIDNAFTFSHHVEKIVKKANTYSYLMHHAFPHCNIDDALMLYERMFNLCLSIIQLVGICDMCKK